MSWVFFNGKFVPEEKAVISVKTHALQYGTGIFEGIRAYFNKNDNSLYIFRMEDHYKRLLQNSKLLSIKIPYSLRGLCDITVNLLKKNFEKQSIYIRPFIYKADTNIASWNLDALLDGITIFTAPFKNNFQTKGIRAGVTSWTRITEKSIPPRAKISGGYVNSALAKTEVGKKGFDEAIFLSKEGHVLEGSSENIFLVEKEKVITPAESEDILPGVTRDTIIKISSDLGLLTQERVVLKKELYTATEIFFLGTGAEIVPVVEIDGKIIGNGKIGNITQKLKEEYKKVVIGENKKYKLWITRVTI